VISKGYVIIANAVVWGLAMVAISFTLRGLEQKAKVVSIMSAGAASCLMINAVGPSRTKQDSDGEARQ
jgi:hypothetical protein